MCDCHPDYHDQGVHAPGIAVLEHPSAGVIRPRPSAGLIRAVGPTLLVLVMFAAAMLAVGWRP